MTERHAQLEWLKREPLSDGRFSSSKMRQQDKQSQEKANLF